MTIAYKLTNKKCLRYIFCQFVSYSLDYHPVVVEIVLRMIAHSVLAVIPDLLSQQQLSADSIHGINDAVNALFKNSQELINFSSNTAKKQKNFGKGSLPLVMIFGIIIVQEVILMHVVQPLTLPAHLPSSRKKNHGSFGNKVPQHVDAL